MTTTVTEMWKALARDPLMRVTGGLLGLLAVPYLAPVLPLPAMQQYSRYTDPVLLGLVLFSLQYGRAPLAFAERRVWNLLSAGMVCWMIARSFQLVRPPLGPGTMWWGVVEDVLYVLLYLFVVLAVEFVPLPQTPSGIAPSLRRVRIAGTAVFVFGLLVYFVVVPNAVNPAAYGTLVPSLLLYVTLDLYLVSRLAGLTARCKTRPWSAIVSFLLATVVLWAVTDTIEVLGYLDILTFGPDSPANLVWFPAYATLVAAARVRMLAAAPQAELAAVAVLPGPRIGGQIVAYAVAVPAAHFTLYAMGLLDPVSRQPREVVALILLLTLAALVLVHQLLLERENARLLAEHDAVARRLSALERVEAVGRLTGGIAHDFNNLLTIVLTHAGLVSDALQPSQSAARADLEELMGAARRGTTLVKKLLGVGRRDMLTFRAVDLGGVVNDFLPSLRRVIPSNIKLQFTAPSRPRPVRADGGAVEQILMNLVANACHAMRAGGVLDVDVSEYHVDSSRPTGRRWAESGDYVSLTVTDTGVGMDDQTRERVFEPFFTMRIGGEGVGLGMAMVYGLVKQHDGFVDVASAPNRGTVVRVLFRLWDGGPVEPKGADAAVGPAVDTRQRTILLVEDEPSILRAAKRMLERAGYRVLVAADGEEGLRVFEANAEDVTLVVSDVMMPKVSGYELYRAVQARRPGTKFLFTSGYAAAGMPGGLELDVPVPFLSKPWTVAELSGKINEVLDGTPSA